MGHHSLTGGPFHLPSPIELAQSLQNAANGVSGPTLKDLYVQESYQMNVLMGYLYNQQELFEKIITHLNKISSSLEEYRSEAKDERLYNRRSEKAREKWLSEIESTMKRFESKFTEVMHSHRSPSESSRETFSNRNDGYRPLQQQIRSSNGDGSFPGQMRTRRIEGPSFNTIPGHSLSSTEGMFYDLIN